MRKRTRIQAIFLDRDGVINKTHFYEGKSRSPWKLEDFEFFEGVAEAIERFRAAGYHLIVVTNQPDVVRGWVSKEVVEAMNARVRSELAVHDLMVCYHTDEHGCECRKPKPGMLIEAAMRWNIDLAASYMIGDRYSDIQAGLAARCKTVLIGPGDASPAAAQPDFRAESLLEAASLLLDAED